MVFARSTMLFDMPNYFHRNIDVWVMGSKGAFRSFLQHLDRRAKGCDENTRLLADKDSPGMDVLLLPTCEDAEQPFLLLQERKMSEGDRTRMELIVGGTVEGFARLCEVFETLLKDNSSEPDDHEHVDTDEPLLLQPSVFLNVRGPTQEWSKEEFGHYWQHFGVPEKEGSSDLRPESSIPYHILTYDDLYARLPCRSNACVE